MYSNEEIAEMLFERRVVADILPAIYDGLSIVELPQEELPELEKAALTEVLLDDPEDARYYSTRVRL